MDTLKKLTLLCAAGTAILISVAVMLGIPIGIPILIGLLGAVGVSMIKPKAKVCSTCIGYGEVLVGINFEMDKPIYEICKKCLGRGMTQ